MSTTGKGSRYVEVPRVDVDRYLRGRGYKNDLDSDVDVREFKGNEITYSKVIQEVLFPAPGKFVVSPAFNGKFSGHNMLVDANDINEVIQSSLQVALTKCLDATHAPEFDKPGHAVIFPKGLHDRSVAWVITQHLAKRGDIVVRVYTSITQGEDKARELGADAIRVVVVYDSTNGLTRGMDNEQRVFRTGSVKGVLQRIGERCDQAEKVRVKQCPRCGAPAYADSGRCILPECRALVIQLDQHKGGPCARCNGPTYTDSGRCINKACRNAGGRSAGLPA